MCCLVVWCRSQEATFSASDCTALWLPPAAPAAKGLLWIKQHTHFTLCSQWVEWISGPTIGMNVKKTKQNMQNIELTWLVRQLNRTDTNIPPPWQNLFCSMWEKNDTGPSIKTLLWKQKTIDYLKLYGSYGHHTLLCFAISSLNRAKL